MSEFTPKRITSEQVKALSSFGAPYAAACQVMLQKGAWVLDVPKVEVK